MGDAGPDGDSMSMITLGRPPYRAAVSLVAQPMPGSPGISCSGAHGATLLKIAYTTSVGR